MLKIFFGDSEEEIHVHLFMNTSNGLSPENIFETIEIFRKLGISENIENLMDCLWDIGYFVLPFVIYTIESMMRRPSRKLEKSNI